MKSEWFIRNAIQEYHNFYKKDSLSIVLNILEKENLEYNNFTKLLRKIDKKSFKMFLEIFNIYLNAYKTLSNQPDIEEDKHSDITNDYYFLVNFFEDLKKDLKIKKIKNKKDKYFTAHLIKQILKD